MSKYPHLFLYIAGMCIFKSLPPLLQMVSFMMFYIYISEMKQSSCNGVSVTILQGNSSFSRIELLPSYSKSPRFSLSSLFLSSSPDKDIPHICFVWIRAISRCLEVKLLVCQEPNGSRLYMTLHFNHPVAFFPTAFGQEIVNLI